MNPIEMRQLRIGRVGVAELTALATIYTATDVFLNYPSRIAQEAATSAWMVPLIAGGICLAVFMMIARMMKQFPDESLLDAASRLIHPVVSKVFCMLFLLLFLAQTALVMREFTETVVTTVLPQTPTNVVALLFLSVLLFYAYKGLEGLTRVSIFLSVILGIGLTALLVMTLNWFNGHSLLPMWGNGIGTTVYYGAENTSVFLNVLILMVLYSTVRNQKHFVVAGAVSIGLTALIMSAFVLVFVGTFPVASTGQVPFPLYQLARLIYVGRFVQRLESVFIFLWVAAAVIKMGFGLWMTAFLYAHAFRMPVYRPLLFGFAVIVYVVGFLPPDFITVQNISERIFEPYGWIIAIASPALLATMVSGASRRTRKRTSGKSDAPRRSKFRLSRRMAR